MARTRRWVCTYTPNDGEERCRVMFFLDGDEQEPDPRDLICGIHDLPLKKAPKSWVDLAWEAAEKAKISFGGYGPTTQTHMWVEEARRKSGCFLCHEDIVKGQQRVALDTALSYQLHLRNGLKLSRKRMFAHYTCFLDALLGGTPGQGCPGCTARVQDTEYRAYKKMLERRHA